MKLGNKILIYIIFFILSSNFNLLAEDRIISTPLINLNEIKPSFEETDDLSNEIPKEEIILNKRKTLNDNKLTAEFIGLDKITAKTSAIVVSLGEIKKFGPLEIKVLKCGKVSSENNMNYDVAYLQVKDLSKSQDEKVFIFNGWTFSNDSSVRPFDHAVYDLQLVKCNSV